MEVVQAIVFVVSVVCGILLINLCLRLDSKRREKSEKERKRIIIPKGHSVYTSVPTGRIRSSTSRVSQNTGGDPVTASIHGLDYGGDTSSSSSSSSSDSSSFS